MWHRPAYIAVSAVFCLCTVAWAESGTVTPGQMDNFSISGLGERGQKNWDLSGKSADIGAQVIKLNDVQGTMYNADNSTVHLTAQKGDFNRPLGQLHLEQDVVVTTSTGAKLTTDSLDWDKKAQLVSTSAQVNIEKEDMCITAQGARGQTDLGKVDFQKDVHVRVSDNPVRERRQEPVTILCDGPLQIDYAANTAVFNNNVDVLTVDCRIKSDTLEVIFRRDPSVQKTDDGGMGGMRIERIIARGNVKITRNDNVSYCGEAVYTAADRKISLSGSPKLVIYSTEDQGASAGDQGIK